MAAMVVTCLVARALVMGGELTIVTIIMMVMTRVVLERKVLTTMVTVIGAVVVGTSMLGGTLTLGKLSRPANFNACLCFQIRGVR